MIVVSDTSPIANLIQIGRLHLLKDVFLRVVIPPAVFKEISALENFGVDLNEFHQSDWILLKEPAHKEEVKALTSELDLGESEAIVLAKELKADWLLMDERPGTQKAESLGLTPIGLVGVLIKAKEKSLIKEVMPVIAELQLKAGFWIGERLILKLKNMLGE